MIMKNPRKNFLNNQNMEKIIVLCTFFLLLVCFISGQYSYSTIDEENINVLIEKANQLLVKKNYEEAIQYYDKVLEIEPNAKVVLNNKGNALSNLGKYEEAIQYYDKVLKINLVIAKLFGSDPNDINTLYSKGNALFALGKYDDAIEHYDKVLEINPNATDVLHKKNLALKERDRK